MEHPIHIAADHRERRSGVIDHLKAAPDVTVDVRTLSLGDSQIDGRLVFERKTLGDFQLSIVDGRLFKQLIRLAASELKAVLIIEGTMRDGEGVQMRREACKER